MQNKHYVDPNSDSGRFAEYDEIKKDYKYVKYDGKLYSKNIGAGLGIEISQDVNGNVTGAIIDDADTNTIIVSSTGAGKTRRVLSQYILSCIYGQESFVLHDPKGELYGFFYTLLGKMGFKVRVINLRDPMTGDRLNFLEEAARFWRSGKQGRAIEVAKGIAETLYLPLEDKNDKFWTYTAINLFLCYFTIAATLLEAEYVTLASIYKIHMQGTEKVGSSTRMGIYLEEHKNEKCYELGIPSITAPNDTRQSIFSVFANGLVRVILNDDIEDMTTKSTFSVNELASPKQPMALFIITRDEAPQTYSTVVSSMVDMIYTSLIDLAQTKYRKTLPRTCHFILEEFGNIAQLSNINDMMTASRSRNIRMVLVVQSLCQLYLHYSKELAHVLIGNAQNLVYMSSTDMELVEMISRRCGNRVDPFTNETRRLLSPERLTHLNKKKGETLFLLDRHYPYISSLPDLSCYKMIEAQDTIKIKTRKKLEPVKIDFIQIVDDIRHQKLHDFMMKNKDEEVERISKEELSKKQMLNISNELSIEMNRIVQSL